MASMPHLSQLQRDYAKKDVTVVSVTSPDRSNTLEAVKKMVEEKAEVMQFTVAFDEGRTTNEAWMKQAGLRGIPSSFLVDGAGKIAWIGHPSMLDLPLDMVVAGKWDYVEGPKMVEKVYGERRAISKMASANPAEALKRLEAFATEHPKIAAGMDKTRFDILVRLPEQRAAAAKLGAKLVDAAIAEKNAGTLNQIAWGLVDPEVQLADRFLDLALRAAEQANALTGEKDAAILDTLARAHFWKGDYEKALSIQRRAVDFAEGRMKESLAPVVEEYEKALGRKRAG